MKERRHALSDGMKELNFACIAEMGDSSFALQNGQDFLYAPAASSNARRPNRHLKTNKNVL
jgi:hypothetical protein